MQMASCFSFYFVMYMQVYARNGFIIIKSIFVSVYLYLILLCAIFALSTNTCEL